MNGYNGEDFKPFALFNLRELELGSYRLAHLGLILKSKGMRFKVVTSTLFDGVEKTCLLVVLKAINGDAAYIRNLVFKDGQLSLVMVNSNRRAYKITKDGSPLCIGQFSFIHTPEELKKCDNWTLDGDDYYSCIE
jgi:hypothetical protein